MKVTTNPLQKRRAYAMNIITQDNHSSELLSSKINILKGVELGLTSDNFSLCHKLLDSYDFDFVIGSCHIVDQMDPYYAEFWEGKNDRDCFELYFKTLLDSLKFFIGRNT